MDGPHNEVCRSSWRWLCEGSQRSPGILCKRFADLCNFACRAMCCAGTGRTSCAGCALMRVMDVAPSSCQAAFLGSSLLWRPGRSKRLRLLLRRSGVPVAQVDVPVQMTKFLTITPSYLYYEVPPSGLNTASEQSPGFTDTLEENQFRIDGTLKFSIRKFEISDRNMYVRRFRQTVTSTAIARKSRSHIPSWSMATSGSRSLALKRFTTRKWWVEQKSSHGWRYGAAPEARVISALVHLGPLSRSRT